MKDVVIKEDSPKTLLLPKHVEFIQEYGQTQNTYVKQH